MKNNSDLVITEVYQKVSQKSEYDVIWELHAKMNSSTCTWISFVYFAALEMNGWYKNTPSLEYRKAIQESDYLLADGIAFRLLHFAFFHPEIPRWRILLQYPKYSKLAVENLNGTDFLPRVLRSFQDAKPRILLYGTTPEILPKAVEYVCKNFWLQAVGFHGYAPLPSLALEGNDPIVLLVGLGTPRQEKWILEHLETLKKRGNVLVFWVGGLFDFWGGLERRAPALVRRSGMEWAWRLMSFPRKNLKKAISSLKFFRELLRERTTENS